MEWCHQQLGHNCGQSIAKEKSRVSHIFILLFLFRQSTLCIRTACVETPQVSHNCLLLENQQATSGLSRPQLPVLLLKHKLLLFCVSKVSTRAAISLFLQRTHPRVLDRNILHHHKKSRIPWKNNHGK